MSNSRKSGWRCLSVLGMGSLLLFSVGCQTATRAQSGALVGSGLGALTGAMIGSNSGHAGGGALIGAATGALAGGLIGDAEDARAERDAAISQAAYAQQAAQAVTNVDVLQLTHSGISDDVIISSMQSQGGRFDLSPQAIIHLKNSGVSDRVILAMQSSGQIPLQPVRPIIVEPRPDVIVVPPGPRFQFSVGSGYHRHWHHGHCY